jgi:hypothetical protein
MVLSGEAVLVYVLADSGVRGRLAAGRIERNPAGELDVFDAQGDRFDYLSGSRMRSWCVLGPAGKPIDGWQHILPEDLSKIIR